MNREQTLFNLAFSAYSKILARLYEKPWGERYFKDGPVSENNVSMFDGVYDSFVIDSPGKAFQVDIYIRVKALEASDVYFWRILYNDDLLDVSNRFYQVFFSNLDSRDYPKGSQSTFATRVEEILAERKVNHPKALECARAISTLSSPEDIAKVLQARPQGASPLPENPGEPPQNKPVQKPSGLFSSPAQRTQVSPPVTVPPTPPSSQPSAPSSPPSSDDSIPGDGPVMLAGSGRESRVAKSSGRVSIEALATSGNQKPSSLMIRLFDANGTEVQFQGKPLLTWERKNDSGYFPAWFKGVEDKTSMHYTDNWSADNKSYSFDIKQNQKIVCEVTSPSNDCILVVDSDSFFF